MQLIELMQWRWVMSKYYLFNEIPGTHKSWTLAVLAVSEHDAREYIKINHPGSKLSAVCESGKVEASCGAITERARLLL